MRLGYYFGSHRYLYVSVSQRVPSIMAVLTRLPPCGLAGLPGRFVTQNYTFVHNHEGYWQLIFLKASHHTQAQGLGRRARGTTR